MAVGAGGIKVGWALDPRRDAAFVGQGVLDAGQECQYAGGWLAICTMDQVLGWGGVVAATTMTNGQVYKSPIEKSDPIF